MTSILTFNVFTGSPLPIRGTRALAGSERLQEQLAGVAGLAPDVACLQEVYSDEVREAYKAHFAKTHALEVVMTNPPRLARVLAEVIVWVTTFSVFLIFYAATCLSSSEEMGYGLAVLLLFAFNALCRTVLRESALIGFLTGRTAGGLAILYNRSTLRLSRTRTVYLKEQRGDLMNRLRPRCIQVADFTRIRVYPITPRGPPVPRAPDRLVIINMHANALGDDSFRASQLNEVSLLAAGFDDGTSDVVVAGDFNAGPTSPSVRQLSACGLRDAASSTGAGDDYTWDARNTLTLGYMRHEDHRSDYVYHRGSGTILDCRVVMNMPPYTSDHFGVLVRMTASRDDDGV